VQRQPKITPKAFVDNLLYNASSDVNQSLNLLSVEMKRFNEIDVSKQALNKRYSESATQFLKSILSKLCMTSNFSINEGWFDSFNRIRIKDSTKFVLPEEFASQMKGFGGVSSKSAAAIQYEYDLKTGSIIDLNITQANRNDATDAIETKDNITENDLIIRDLGYFSIDVIKHFIKADAFIISKLNAKTLVYEKKNEEFIQLDFKNLYLHMQKNKLQHIEKQIYIGSKHKLQMRIIINIIPDEIYNQRMQKINAYNKRMGYKTSDDYSNRARFNLIITNISKETIPFQTIEALYHTRWQVELIFKIWKSTFGIHKIRKMKYYRWLSILYAKLILIVVYWYKIMPLRTYLYKHKGKLLSIDKCFKTMKSTTSLFRDAIKKEIEYFTNEIYELISNKHWLEKKKNKLNFEQIMYLSYCNSGFYVYI